MYCLAKKKEFFKKRRSKVDSFFLNIFVKTNSIRSYFQIEYKKTKETKFLLWNRDKYKISKFYSSNENLVFILPPVWKYLL